MNLIAFAQRAVSDLQAPINSFYDAMGSSGPLSGIRHATARAQLEGKFIHALTELVTEAARIGSPGSLPSYEAVQEAVAEQLPYVHGFMQAILDDELSRDSALRRAASYVPAVLHVVSDNLTSELPTLPQYPGDGQTECDVWCKCSVQVQKLAGDGNWDVFWRLGQAEHCVDCVRLSVQWNPLPIRHGVVGAQKSLSAYELVRVRSALALVSGEYGL